MDHDRVTEIITVDASGAPGLSAKEVRGTRFRATSRGVRVPADAAGNGVLLAHAALAGCVEGAVLCDVTAARLWGLPLPPWMKQPSAQASVAVARGAAEPRRVDVQGRRLSLPAFHVTTIDDVRVTTPARTWMDCASLVPFVDLVAMGDAILHRELCPVGELAHLLQWGYRRRGIVNIRRALPLLDPRAESPGESRTRMMLLAGRIRAPRCNFDVFVNGRWIARVDMAWLAEKVIVEYDGAGHLDEKQRRRDAERLNQLQAAGWRVIVLTADDLRRPEATCALVRRALATSR